MLIKYSTSPEERRQFTTDEEQERKHAKILLIGNSILLITGHQISWFPGSKLPDCLFDAI